MAGGRPRKLTAESLEKLIESISLGGTYELACNYAGVSYSSFRVWMINGETATSGPERELFLAVKHAEGAATAKWLKMIEQAAADGNWPAAAWKLERRYPDMYGRKVNENRNTHSGPDGGPIKLSVFNHSAVAAALTAGSAEDPEDERDD